MSPLLYLKWFVVVADINIEVVRRVEVIDHGVALVVIVGALDGVNYLGQHVERLTLVVVLEPVRVDLLIVTIKLARALTICEHIEWRGCGARCFFFGFWLLGSSCKVTRYIAQNQVLINSQNA